MDPLDHLAGPAIDLLARVDDVLDRVGAPDNHRLWPLLRRVRALPGDAAGAIFALRPSALAAAADTLRGLHSAYDEARAALLAPPPWSGAAATAYESHRTALVGALGPDGWGLTGRLAQTVSYLDDVAGWAAASREALARVLADALCSAEAVAVLGAVSTADPATGDRALAGSPESWTDDPAFAGPVRVARADVSGVPPSWAAAEIGAQVLTVAADTAERAQELLGRAAPGAGGAVWEHFSGLDGGPATGIRLAY